MRAADVIRAKRDGQKLGREAIASFVDGARSGRWPDYQVSALLMAVFLRGMDEEETTWLTEAMVASGGRLDLGAIPGPKVDKHSTGGVGDKTSIVVAPLAAACGVIVPMISGRGLGHTGGTLDKLEAIPGFRTELSPGEIAGALEATGCAIVGQTAEMVPADRVLYALRDVTATVESLPLITASIMSKKIAEGIEALVLDVKTGRGAMMKDLAASRALARTLVAVGRHAGLRIKALVTDMNAPLGRAVGNAVEIVECLETLKGRGPADLEALAVRLTAEMLVAAGAAASVEAGEGRARSALASGDGLERLRQMIVRQGGDARVVDDYGRLPAATRCHAVCADRTGHVAAVDAELVGRASVLLGAGRNRAGEPIDPGVGILVRAKPGEHVRSGEPVLVLCYQAHRATEQLTGALSLAAQAVRISDTAPAPGPLVIEDTDV